MYMTNAKKYTYKYLGKYLQKYAYEYLRKRKKETPLFTLETNVNGMLSL